MTQKYRYDIIGNIGLIDADLLDNGTRHPNLVIMKLSNYFKNRGCTVSLIEDYNTITKNNYKNIKKYDAIYISKVFGFTKIDRKILNFKNVYYGGTGFYFNGGKNLPKEIEHTMPDYHIYDNFIKNDKLHINKSVYWKDYTDFSIGYATRGCFRRCKFCVNRKYKRVKFHSHISEWLDLSRPRIYLWDDNIFAYPKWKSVFEELIATGKSFQFRQGLDIRLLTEEKAKLLSKVKYYGDIIFAFDNLKDKEIIEEKLNLWRKYSNKSTKLYILSGFESQDEYEIESIFKRISIVMKYGCLPYIMRHEKYLNSKYKGMFTQIARWCNQPQFLKKMSFRQYCDANQFYKKDKTTKCSAKQAMDDFEVMFPQIAEQYFDMKFDKQQKQKKEVETISQYSINMLHSTTSMII